MAYQGDPQVERLAFVESHETQPMTADEYDTADDEYNTMDTLYSYEYDSSVSGLTIKCGTHGSCFMQGEEAERVHDELEAIDKWEDVVQVLTEYEHVCE